MDVAGKGSFGCTHQPPPPAPRLTRTAHKARRTPHTQTQTQTQTHFSTSCLGAASVRLQKRRRHPRDWLDSLGHVWTGVGRACFWAVTRRCWQTAYMSLACTLAQGRPGQHELVLAVPLRAGRGEHVTLSRWIAAACSMRMEEWKSLHATDWWTRQGLKVTRR
jgi:hypothetical protein